MIIKKIGIKNFTSNSGPRKSPFQKLIEVFSSCFGEIKQMWKFFMWLFLSSFIWIYVYNFFITFSYNSIWRTNTSERTLNLKSKKDINKKFNIYTFNMWKLNTLGLLLFNVNYNTFNNNPLLFNGKKLFKKSKNHRVFSRVL